MVPALCSLLLVGDSREQLLPVTSSPPMPQPAGGHRSRMTDPEQPLLRVMGQTLAGAEGGCLAGGRHGIWGQTVSKVGGRLGEDFADLRGRQCVGGRWLRSF